MKAILDTDINELEIFVGATDTDYSKNLEVVKICAALLKTGFEFKVNISPGWEVPQFSKKFKELILAINDMHPTLSYSDSKECEIVEERKKQMFADR